MQAPGNGARLHGQEGFGRGARIATRLQAAEACRPAPGDRPGLIG